ncbi:hypothetical protein [Mangrovimonas futianensis]|uniref:hypothetical protein n=1 Tax=Mangrovimonas futianensis TaxID=2895523 RepID=UPI001E4FFC67|nr:hypothetical protein [Mangrovimonas futianensis]MCF1420445.1 hypothetical protein [Mangrovimonas futianensis]
MTAVIGILNKHGVTMAADSAVTVTGGNQKKIYNTANKLFTLSKHHPIGIMIYSSSTFMSTPWEIIIKLYRKELKDKSFDTVVEYKDDFLKFLKGKDFYTTPEHQLLNLKQFLYWQLDILKGRMIEKLSDDKTEEELSVEFQEIILEDLQNNIDSYNGATNILNDFADYSLENFKEYAEEGIKEVTDTIFDGIEINDDIFNAIVELYYNHLKTTNFIGITTGIVFGGYGEKEIYPSMVSIQIAEALDNRLRYYDFDSCEISDNNNGAIMPYAQTDVINMFIKGIDPEIDYTYITVFKKLLADYTNIIVGILNGENDELAQKINGFDLSILTTEFEKQLNQLKREKQVSPTLDTVAILSKEDLAEMAESLIYLTYLKRRISSTEESVGGPIDVAIISKGDGFIWKKRKHYFEESLNKHFMANYFNN